MKNLSDVDALFTLPPGEFVAARSALAARLKKAGQAEEAERVKAMVKPSATAWAVNQLYCRHRREFDRLNVPLRRFDLVDRLVLNIGPASRTGRNPRLTRRCRDSFAGKLAAWVPSSTTFRCVWRMLPHAFG
jgi:hypothetical protein